MRTLRARLTLSYLAVTLIGMGIIAPLAWLAVERLYLNTQSASLLAQAELVASALRGQVAEGSAPSPYSQTTNTLPGIHTRVIDAQGGVVIDLSALNALPASAGLDLPPLTQNASALVTPEELTDRPEIAQALAGTPATMIRSLTSSPGKRVLYAAAPVLSEEGKVAQIVYLATPLPDNGWAGLPVEVRWQFAGVILGALLLASAVGLLFARRISRPLGKLAEAAHAVSDGNLNQEVPVDAAFDEMAVLGRSFNHMTAALRQSDLAKTAFISDVSHELRTPLTVIKGTIETLQDGALDDLSARGPFLDSMNRETERLIRLVNDLLVLTRADAGALNLHLNPLDLEALAQSRCAHMQPVASRRQVRLEVESGPVQAVLADADRIAQVLDNLLDNAIRYSPPGGVVTIILAQEGGGATCTVKDQGPGIPARHLPLIFERFYRADPARDRGQGGSGLGLAIVRSLVQAHGGHAVVRSIEGQGTAFTFWLPLAQN